MGGFFGDDNNALIGGGNYPDEYYLPDVDFLQTRPFSTGVGEGAEISRDHISAEREVASIAHELVTGPNGNLVVYLVKPKSLDLILNQARAVTAWHGPSTAALLLMNVANEATLVASVSKQQMLWLPAHDWLDSCSKLIGLQVEGDNRLAIGVNGEASGLRDAIPIVTEFGKKKLGLD